MNSNVMKKERRKEILHSKREGWLWMFLLVLFFSSLFICIKSFNVHAACAHASLGEQFYESRHPHAYYRHCKSCGDKIYTGEYFTKPHGSGENGTCSMCGRHQFSSRTCTKDAACYCGTTLPAYGHSYGEVYSEATHPHRYYKRCSRCNTVTYTGGNATKLHGDGAWGSGTCPSCGSHQYIGQSCTNQGVCACGAKLLALGHTYGPQYCTAEHPHRYYKQCSRCQYRLYTGGTATKKHGTGEWGSGTCPSCGSHRYIGQSCTKEGLCICGSKLQALGHAYGPQYCTAEHPHPYYKQCSRCKYTWYTGGNATKKHGTGKWGSGTCRKCGQHSYVFEEYNMMTHPHPHPAYKVCDCGERVFLRNIEYDSCSKCREGRKIVEIEEYKTATLIFPDGDKTAPFLRAITLSLKINYYERYKFNNGEFISYEASNSCDAVNASEFQDVPVWIVANPEINYYNSSGNKIFLRELVLDSYMVDTKSSASGGFFYTDGVPAYSDVRCAAYVKGSMYACVRNITAYYS